MIRRAEEKNRGQDNRPVYDGSMLQMNRYYARHLFTECSASELSGGCGGICTASRSLRQFGELFGQGEPCSPDHQLRPDSDQNITALPTIENKEKGVRFERHYRRQGSRILFTTVLEADGMTEVSEIPLYPVTGEELLTSLKDAGFAAVEKFGSFRGDSFDIASSQPLILRCHKQ